MSWTLLIMAAGLGSRFGGDKQLVEVGPGGEAFFDYAVRDARAAGADQVVLIVRSEIEDQVSKHLQRQHPGFEFSMVRQDEHGPERPKPWGTAHAILTAADAVTGPFLVVNADDYYGPSSYRDGATALLAAPDDGAVIVAFELSRTLPRTGAVSRGVCRTDASGQLETIIETHGIERRADGVIASTDPVSVLNDDTAVSMNMFGFQRGFFDELRHRWPGWLAANRDGEKTEFLLPAVVAELMAEGRLSVEVVPSSEDWIGVTNPDDLEPARAVLAER